MSRRRWKSKPKDEDKPKARRFGERELESLRVQAWRAGFVVICEGRYYQIARKPDLNGLLRDNIKPTTAIAVSPRLFSTDDGNELLWWLAENDGRRP
jgi:hypothetical protein